MGKNAKTESQLMHNFLGSYASLNHALAHFGYPGKPLLTSAVPALKDLAPERAAEILATVRAFEKLLVASESGHVDVLQTPAFMAAAFRELQLTYSKDFLATLGPDDIVDGYNLEALQIFRNFRFIEMCGYCLHDLLTHPWPTLFERSQVITNQLLASVEEVLRTGKTVSLDHIPEHYMKERMSQDRQIVKVKFKAMGPIFASAGKPAGVLASSTAEFVDEKPDRDDLRFI